MQLTAPVYPAQDQADVVLRDGSTLRLRPVRTDDGDGLRALHDRLSEATREVWPHGLSAAGPAGQPLTGLDYDAVFGLVAEAGGHLAGVATYQRNGRSPERADVVVVIDEPLRGRGIGTRMLEVLAAIARDHQIATFDARVRPGNERMMQVLLDCGFALERQFDGDVLHVSLALQPTAAYEAQAAARLHAATRASMNAFFEPKTVAVVGANRERGRIGSEILHNLVRGDFAGRLFAVHPTAASIDGVATYPSVRAIPDRVDLAVICVPCAAVNAVVDDCIVKGVGALVIISAGFGETGADGRAREAEILAKARSAGIRVIGPNCMGIINTDPAVRLNATFAPVAPIPGRVAFSTQSGALGLAILDCVQRLNLGISTFVSVGNSVDVSGNDLLEYRADDPRTDVILLYLESFGDPRRFAQLAQRVAERKPIVAVKSGRSQAGARAASSHTGALAASDVVVDALFRQAGVIRTRTLEELFGVAALLAHQPLPAGRRVAILSNAGGPAILAADACTAEGLEIATLSVASSSRLRRLLPPAASIGNPIDMIASATAAHYQGALEVLLADEQVDSVLVIFIPPLVTQPDDVARAIVAAAAGGSKPVLANFIRTEGAPPALAPIPSYLFPEAAVSALARATEYSTWRQRPRAAVVDPSDTQVVTARAVVDGALRRGDGWLTPDESQRLLGAVGVPVAVARVVNTDAEAAAAARAIGYPVALKAVGPEIVHKTDVGGVVLDIRDEAALDEACGVLRTRLGATMTAMVVQQMVPGGVELLVGAVLDATFGPLVACGTGGVLVDLLGDTAFRLHPLTEPDARELVGGLKSIRLLRGYRGQPPADEHAVVDALLRVSTLMTICPEIHELDINPLVVLERGVVALDVRVRVARPGVPPPTRRLAY